MRTPTKSDDHTARIAEHARRVAAEGRRWGTDMRVRAAKRKRTPNPHGRPGIAVVVVGTGERFASILKAAVAVAGESDRTTRAAEAAIARAVKDGRPAFGRQWYRADRPGVWWNRKAKAA